MTRLAPLILAVALFLGAAARDRFDAWVDATVLPALTAESSVEVLDRHGELLRAYTVSDGRWRLALAYADTDPGFVRMLLAYEDKRFWDHGGVDLFAVARAVGQAATSGHIVSGGSTLTMQVARILEDGPTGSWAGKLRQARRDIDRLPVDRGETGRTGRRVIQPLHRQAGGRGEIRQRGRVGKGA